MHFWIILTFLMKCASSNITVLTRTPAGNIIGFVDSGKFDGRQFEVISYLGIPYAKPPTGDLRFAKPVRMEPFEETFEATTMGSMCKQIQDPSLGSEDCLNLNVVVPGTVSDEQKRAVIVYIHGGWWQYGSQDLFYSPQFAYLNDVIFVTLNYRLNVYGFLAHEEYGFHGNYGLWDQQLAIQWVHDNIEAFGGDRDRVTIVGNSAGAASVIAQALYPGNKGLFQGVIAQSGAPIAAWAVNEDYKTAFIDFVERNGCGSRNTSETAACLRNLDGDDIRFDQTLLEFTLHLFVHDGEFVTFSPGDFYEQNYGQNMEFFDRLSSVNLIIGQTSDDGSWNYREWSDIVSERGSNFALGITQYDFSVLGLFFELLVGLRLSNIERLSIVNQYLDWSDPNNLVHNRDAFLDYSKDVEFSAGTTAVAAAHALGRGPGVTYMYEFDHKPSYSKTPFYIKGAIHEEELPFVFGLTGRLVGNESEEDPASRLPREEVEMSLKLQSAWATFAKLSHAKNLSAVLAMEWPQYTKTGKQYLKFRSDGTATHGFLRGDAAYFWNVLMPRIRKALVTTTITCSGGVQVGQSLISLIMTLTIWFIYIY